MVRIHDQVRPGVWRNEKGKPQIPGHDGVVVLLVDGVLTDVAHGAAESA